MITHKVKTGGKGEVKLVFMPAIKHPAAHAVNGKNRPGNRVKKGPK